MHGRHAFVCEGTYLHRVMANFATGSPTPAKHGPASLSLETGSRSALVGALPGSPYKVTKVLPTQIEFEGIVEGQWEVLYDKGRWQGIFDRVTGRLHLSGPRVEGDYASFDLTCRQAQRLF